MTVNLSVTAQGTLDPSHDENPAIKTVVTATIQPVVKIVIENGKVISKTISPSSGGWGASGYKQTSVNNYTGGVRVVSTVQSVSITSVTWAPKTKN